MDQGMSFEQSQALHLTLKMRQSIKILQMNMIELGDWLEKELQRNPALEVESGETAEAKHDKEYVQGIYGENGLHKNHPNHGINWQKWEEKQSFFSYLSESKGLVRNHILTMKQEGNDQYFVSQTTTLHDHLLLCLKIAVTDDVDFKIGEYLVGNINQNGYLVVSCLEVAKDLNIPEKRVRRVLAITQNCSSIPGLGARNLKECLLLQLKYLKLEEKDILRKIIVFYLNELSQKKFKEICKALHVSRYDVQNLLDFLIKNFDPKPGRIFYQNSEISFLVPDIIIKKIDNKYEIIENRVFLPSIKINPIYKHMLEENKPEGVSQNQQSMFTEKGIEHQKTLRYLKSKMNQAHWVIRCVEQRGKTLFDITQFIIDYQREFLEKGVAYLKPLSMKTVSDSLGLHESTISRAISEKKIQLPRGFYDMKFFFSRSLTQNQEEAISNEKIKSLLKKYILGEDPYHPYSDQELAEILQTKENIQVARRTVNKYRKILDISPSKIRRKYRKTVKYTKTRRN